MSEHVDLIIFQEILIVLGAVSIVIPLFYRLRLSPVLGFLLIGMVLGPNAVGALVRQIPGLDWMALADRERIGTIAEFGVVFLMFMIGLELSFERLMLMRRLVFGLGPLQTLLSAGVIALVAMFLGQTTDDAIVIGLALTLSSTAVVIQVLAEERPDDHDGGPNQLRASCCFKTSPSCRSFSRSRSWARRGGWR